MTDMHPCQADHDWRPIDGMDGKQCAECGLIQASHYQFCADLKSVDNQDTRILEYALAIILGIGLLTVISTQILIFYQRSHHIAAEQQ